MRYSPTIRFAAVLSSMMVLTGCASASPVPATVVAASTPPATKFETESPESAAIAEIFSGLLVDYDTLESTRSIEAISDVVITGKVDDVHSGPVFGRPDDDFGDITTVVITISDVTVVSGELPAGTDGNVYLNVLAPNGADRSNFLEAVPRGTELALYALQYQGDGGMGVIKEADGRPEGQPLYISAHPQGLAIKTMFTDPSRSNLSEIVWPFTGTVDQIDLAEALPGGTATGADTGLH